MHPKLASNSSTLSRLGSSKVISLELSSGSSSLLGFCSSEAISLELASGSWVSVAEKSFPSNSFVSLSFSEEGKSLYGENYEEKWKGKEYVLVNSQIGPTPQREFPNFLRLKLPLLHNPGEK